MLEAPQPSARRLRARVPGKKLPRLARNESLEPDDNLKDDNLKKETCMKLTEFFLTELDREVERSRRALEQVPEGKYDWKPHEKSMTFGYLAEMVATMPSWLAMAITMDELDIAPTDGSTMRQEPKKTSAALLKGL